MFAILRVPIWFAPRGGGSPGGDHGRGRRARSQSVASSISPAPDPDAILFARLRTGDSAALATLVEHHFSRLADIALVYVKTHDLAEEAAQDVFVRLWETRDRLIVERSVASYLNRAVRNRALRMLEMRDRDARVQARVATESVDAAQVWNEADMDMESAELQAAVNTILATLQPRVQEIFLLYHERGMRSGEIAVLLGVAPATVYNQLSRALKALAAGLVGWRE